MSDAIFNPKNFGIQVNPYDFLGLKRDCTDLHLLKKAYYNKMSNNGASGEQYLDLVHKCFAYLKRLIKAENAGLIGTIPRAGRKVQNGGARKVTPYDELRATPSMYYGGSNAPPPTLLTRSNATIGSHLGSHLGSPIQPILQTNDTTTQQQQFKADQQLLLDNSIIGDNMNVNKALHTMMLNRPTSTNYRDLCNTEVTNGDSGF